MAEEEPIGRRTRTRVPMQHVSLDDLEGLLGEEPDDELFDEEGHEYQQFLRVRHTVLGRDTDAACGVRHPRPSSAHAGAARGGQRRRAGG